MEWRELQVGVQELHLRKLQKLTQELNPCLGDFASFEAGLEAWLAGIAGGSAGIATGRILEVLKQVLWSGQVLHGYCTVFCNSCRKTRRLQLL